MVAEEKSTAASAVAVLGSEEKSLATAAAAVAVAIYCRLSSPTPRQPRCWFAGSRWKHRVSGGVEWQVISILLSIATRIAARW